MTRVSIDDEPAAAPRGRPPTPAAPRAPDPLAFYRLLAGYPALASYRAKLLAVVLGGVLVPAFILVLAIVLGAGRVSALALIAVVLVLAAASVALVVRGVDRLLAPLDFAVKAIDDVALERPLERAELPGSDAAAQILRGVQALVARVEGLGRDARERAERDELTGLYARRAGRERAQAVVDRECHRGRVVRALVADVDDFRAFNARHGAGTGDAILKTIAARLARLAGEEGVAVRWHADTFLLVESAAPGALADAGDLLGRPIVVKGAEEPLTLSVGSAETLERVPVDRLIGDAEASLALAQARRARR